MSKLIPTPGQTVGPYFGIGMPYEGGPQIVPGHHEGAVRLSGTVYDGAGDPVPDSMVEIWQADQHGEVSNARGALERDGFTFTGFGRAAVSREGVYSFTTVEPGAVSGTAPFIAMIVFARGLTNKLHTRVYLPGDDDVLARDPLLASLPADRRETLIATRLPDGSLHHDIRLQGEQETVFLDFG